MEQIECVNYDCIDADDKRPEYFIIRYVEGSYAVYKEYPAYCEDNALDAFADFSRDRWPGFTPSPEYIEELRADAIADGHIDDGNGGDEVYIEDFYMRAGNDGAWLEMPAAMECLTLAELDAREWTIIPPKE